MPLYEYACKTCDERLEVRQSFRDPPLSVHESCGGELRRVLQPVGIVFKGSGWYITDSRKSSPSTAETKSESTAPAAA